MKFTKKFVWSVPLAALLVAAAVIAFSSPPANVAEAARGGGGGGSSCEGDVKVEGDYAHIVAPPGKAILYVCIKAGNEVFTYNWGESGDGCYKLEWRCHCEVRVTGGGTSSDCKEISHVAVTFEDIDCDEYK